MEKKIKDIQQEYKEKDDLELPDFIEEYIRDGRPGVAKIIGAGEKKTGPVRTGKAAFGGLADL